MLLIHRSHSSRSGKRNIIIIAALLPILLVGLFLAASSGSTRAQASTFPPNSVVATVTGLNLREQPTAYSQVVAIMPVNARAVVMGGPFNYTWYWLDYYGTRGYANGYYLVLVADKYTPAPTQTPSPTGTWASPTTTPTSSTATPSTAGTASVTPQASASTTPQGTPTPDYTAPTTPGDYTGLWLAEMAYSGNVRSGPGLDQPVVKGWWVGRRVLLYQAVTDSKGGVWYRVSEPPEAPMWVHSSLIRRVAPVQFDSPVRFQGRWVNVNISQQVVTAYEDGKPVMVTLASTGKGQHETIPGVWKIYWRLPKQTMEGGNKASGDYYKLKDVPYPQYFQISGESLHGTYWHDNFGRPMSHGCVNLSIPIAGWFYGWASIGTIVYVHY